MFLMRNIIHSMVLLEKSNSSPEGKQVSIGWATHSGMVSYDVI